MRDILNFDLSSHNTFGIHAACKRFVEIETPLEASSHNTFGIHAACKRFVEIETPLEAADFFKTANLDNQPFLIIGGGSNLLLTNDFKGVVVRSAIMGMTAEERDGMVWLRCGSGEVFDDVVTYAVNNGWYGMENLSLIPGDVGASAVQNIGAYGAEAKDIIHSIEAVETSTGKQSPLSPTDCLLFSSQGSIMATSAHNSRKRASLSLMRHSSDRSLSIYATPNFPTQRWRATPAVSSSTQWSAGRNTNSWQQNIRECHIILLTTVMRRCPLDGSSNSVDGKDATSGGQGCTISRRWSWSTRVGLPDRRCSNCARR